MTTYRVTIDGDNGSHVYDYDEMNDADVAFDAIRDVLSVLGYGRYSTGMYDNHSRSVMYVKGTDRVVITLSWMD